VDHHRPKAEQTRRFSGIVDRGIFQENDDPKEIDDYRMIEANQHPQEEVLPGK
jgi:hypothetical protein